MMPYNIPIIYANHPVDSHRLYTKAPFELMLLRGQRDSDTLEGDFIVGVNKYVGNDMFNEYVDVSQPLFHLVIKGDTNYIQWEKYNGSQNMQYKEYDVYKDYTQNAVAGKLVIFMGGLYKENPYQWMNICVDSYITRSAEQSHISQILNMVEATMDNPWVRVVLLSNDILDSLFDTSQNG